MATIGQELDYSNQFTNTSGGAADPTTVTFRLVEAIDGTELLWTYNVSPVSGTHYPVGANPIVRLSTGLYTVAWIARKPERTTGRWQGSGVVFQTGETTFLVRHSAVPSLEV